VVATRSRVIVSHGVLADGRNTAKATNVLCAGLQSVVKTCCIFCCCWLWLVIVQVVQMVKCINLLVSILSCAVPG
jgi:hypothetical protein